ncbi:GNAT family N-acetyltransferase [Halopelagius longus]|uniref:Acetyltransferase (GNAT) family protein n=1 Tax=Halopelagius longus TaxID=1236180 RepID=A0A1H1BE53_9EURY|nr:GNAT family N-acetyltransferase [Halopelagius longus]RDI70753.1 GNAT family N-acetyltransferase [Halopelagius longus]SDQ50182.1 Acetyltransferase (GNAT) family protein [Halopelagius longus]
MELIEAEEDDLDTLVDYWYSLARAMESYDELNKLVYTDIDEVSDDGFRAHLDDDEITDYLVIHEGETIGFVTLREGHHSSRQYSRYLRIVNLAIDESHRNRGHGTNVIERVEEIAREMGCDHLKVSCEWHNEGARRFYRDTEFRPKQVDYAQPLE